MSIINKPEVSMTTALAYEILLVFIIAIAVFFLYAAFFTPMGIIPGIVAATASAIVAVIILRILTSLYQTRYILTDKELVIKTSIFIGGSKTIPLRTVRCVEKTFIPFGIKLFGASFHGGHYHIPGLGRAFLAITNFKDGLLIKTDQSNYVITPSNPMGFKKTVENRIENL